MNEQKRPQDENKNSFFNKNPLLVFAIFSIIAVMVFKSFVTDGSFEGGISQETGQGNVSKKIDYFELKQLISQGGIDKVMIGETTLKAYSGKSGQGVVYTVERVNPDNTLIPLLDEKKVSYGAFSEKTWFGEIIFGWVLPIFIFFGIWMFLASRMQKNMGNGILGMGNMKKFISSEKPSITFSDVAGNDEAKEEVLEIVEFLKTPERYIKLGAKIPKGVLLVGPPGTGKTLLAKAVAGEASVPFFSVSGSSFIEMFVGVGASRVRDLFEQAKKDAPAIIFIDEIDAIGKSRASGGFSGNDEREQTLNQLLAEMDGFGSEAPVIVLAATNRPEILDPALLRPGRFDRQVLVDKPDFKGRIEILKVHIKSVTVSKDVDLDDLARLTAGLAGADLANIINEAALLAGRANCEEVNQDHFKEAVERALAGLEKKSRRISLKERKIVAYHESGHALLAETTKGAKKVNKVSIVPRGLAALGYTLNTPEENKYLMQKHELIAEVDVLLGGRAAEEVFLGEISTGAANDLERSTDVIKAMAMYYGMSEFAGLMVLEKQRSSFLGNGYGSAKEYSDATAQKLDDHIKMLLEERYEVVKQRLRDYAPAIEKMTSQLLEIEVIDGEEVRKIVREFEIENNLPTLLCDHDDELSHHNGKVDSTKGMKEDQNESED